ncbi:hypothetical protein G4D82_12570 [Flavobacterium sp. CYK-4]|uniref:hypothetical protein n=1 Tax=Flavobacterium lotistagni TaxID=2709660 RepID=UPI0014095AF5|nr:hypothetical protein [Flavobacterium lotistagni]NHM08058.1 hypothetical protein [Flavobacterium lotistagni]
MEEATKPIKLILLLIFLGLTSAQAQKKGQYNLPEGLTEKNQKQFIQFFTEGEAYYAVSCAECHNKKVKRKTEYPKFTPEQLELYIMRVKNPEHTERLTTNAVSDEELQKIMHFLKYKKN